jgi:hypothetical protein
VLFARIGSDGMVFTLTMLYSQPMHLPWHTLNELAEGVFPAHQTMGRGYDYDAPNSVHKLPFDKLADFEPNFHTVKIHGNAKLFDLLSSVPIRHCGLLISEKFRELLQGFRLPKHRLYPLPATYRNKPLSGYYWLHLPQPEFDLSAAPTIAAAEDLIRAHPEIAELDLVALYRPVRFGYFFVSERLRTAIEKIGLRGIRFGTSKLFRTKG